jgi:hypothetical protein
MAKRFGSSQTFSRINTPTFSNPVILHTYPPMKMEQTECSETSAYKIQTPGNYPEDSIQHSEHGESLKSSTFTLFRTTFMFFNILQEYSKKSCIIFSKTVYHIEYVYINNTLSKNIS